MDSEVDDLSSNPFFLAFQRNQQLVATCAAKEALICVPSAESLKLCKLTVEFLSTHILISASSSTEDDDGNNGSTRDGGSFTTLNGKVASLKDGRIICGTGFPRPRTVMVVYEEDYYDDDMRKLRIVRTNFPLEGKIPLSYYKAIAAGVAMDLTTLNARTLPEHQAVLCRVSGGSYASLASTLFSPEQALANIGASPSPHLTPHPSLPPVFGLMRTFIASFNTSYVLVRGFEDHAGKKVSDACSRIREQMLNAIHGDGSSNGSSSGNASSSRNAAVSPSSSRLIQLEGQAAIDACVYAAIHSKLFQGLIELHSDDELRTQRALSEACGVINMETLGIRESIRCNPTNAILHLQQAINGPFAVTPIQKLCVLDQVNTLLTQAVDARLAEARAQASAATDTNEPGSNPASTSTSPRSSASDLALSADDMLPLWIYVILQARFQFIHANLAYMHHFSPNTSNNSDGSNGGGSGFGNGASGSGHRAQPQAGNIQQLKVHLATLQAAVQYIDSGRAMSTHHDRARRGSENDGTDEEDGDEDEDSVSDDFDRHHPSAIRRSDLPPPRRIRASSAIVTSNRSAPDRMRGNGNERPDSRQLLKSIGEGYQQLVQQFGATSLHHQEDSSPPPHVKVRRASVNSMGTRNGHYPSSTASGGAHAPSSIDTGSGPRLLRMDQVDGFKAGGTNHSAGFGMHPSSSMSSAASREASIMKGRLTAVPSGAGPASTQPMSGRLPGATKTSTLPRNFTSSMSSRSGLGLSSGPGVLRLDDADLPKLVVERTTNNGSSASAAQPKRSFLRRFG